MKRLKEKLPIRDAETPGTAECAKFESSVWERLRPMPADRKGFTLLITTPNGDNWVYDTWKRGKDAGYHKWESSSGPPVKLNESERGQHG